MKETICMPTTRIPPIGGYAYAGVWTLVGLATPIAAYDILKEGKPLIAVVALLIGIPFAYFMTKEGITQNRRVYRERIRQWAETPTKAAKHRRHRLVGISLFGLAGTIDILVLNAPVVRELVMIGGLLVFVSMISVSISSARRVDWWAQIKAN